jgi:hypothetical protein
MQSQRSRVGILFGLVFALPFLFLAGAGLFRVIADPNHPRIAVVLAAAFAAVAGVTVLSGWWWAARSRRGAGWFLLTGLVMGLAWATTLVALSLPVYSLWRGNPTSDLRGLGEYFAIATPVATVWAMLLGTLVWWRIRVLERRLAD